MVASEELVDVDVWWDEEEEEEMGLLFVVLVLTVTLEVSELVWRGT